MSYSNDMRVADLTLGQLQDWLREQGFSFAAASEPKYGYGVKCIMERFGCSQSKAMRLRNDVLAPACYQPIKGGKLRIDLAMADELYNQYCKENERINPRTNQ